MGGHLRRYWGLETGLVAESCRKFFVVAEWADAQFYFRKYWKETKDVFFSICTFHAQRNKRKENEGDILFWLGVCAKVATNVNIKNFNLDARNF